MDEAGPVVTGRLKVRAAVGRFGEAEFPAAVGVRIEREYVAALFVLMSQPMALPVCSAPLICTGACQAPPAPGGSSCDKGRDRLCAK